MAFGSLFVSIGMMVNGGDSPENPAWVMVSTFRNILLLPIVAAGIGYVLVSIREAWERKSQKIPEEAVFTPPLRQEIDPEQQTP